MFVLGENMFSSLALIYQFDISAPTDIQGFAYKL